MSNKEKNLKLIVFLFLFISFLAGATYAYMYFSIDVTNSAYSSLTACFDVEYDITNDDGTAPITGTLFQTATPKGGLSGKVAINIKPDCDAQGYAKVSLNVKSGSDVLFQTVGAHCENSKTLVTLDKYTTEEACISSSGAKWVTEGSALKYAVYEGVNSELVSVGYVNKKGTIDIHRGIKLSHTPRTMYIYIWLDGELADNSYANAFFEGDIAASAEYISNNPNAPVLDDGMIPVTISDNGDVFTVDKNDPNWYDYYNQKWANVVLVNNESRNNYLNNLSNNVQVDEDDILAYYVWIPRYKYRIPYENDERSAVSIDIEFESANLPMSKGDAVNTYYTHPSFWWDENSNGVVNAGETIAGIWVGKFKSTPDKSSACYVTADVTNCNNTTQNPTILPNERPLTYQIIGNQFSTSQNLTKSGNIYGLSNGITDGHMMKNRDWGAVLYLSHSKYGINSKMSMNNDDDCITGFGTSDYGTLTEYTQSTTGNITGIFDMSHDYIAEYVMGNYDKKTNENFPVLPAIKYYDLYLSSQFSASYGENINFCTLETCGGHATMETTNWYDSYGDFIDSNYPWFTRGVIGWGEDNGGFYFVSTTGAAENFGFINAWRSVLVVMNG